MLAGLVQACSKVVSAAKDLSKAALGQNPNGPLYWMNLLLQIVPMGGGGGARSEGLSDNRSGSMMDSINQAGRTAQMQSARAPAAPPPQR